MPQIAKKTVSLFHIFLDKIVRIFYCIWTTSHVMYRISYLLLSVDGADLVEGLNAGRESPMHAEDLNIS